MNCDQFQQRVHHLLDCREPLSDDADLLQHAEQCAACEMQLQLWPKINASFSDTPMILGDDQDQPADDVTDHVDVVASRSARGWRDFGKSSLGALTLAAALLCLAVSSQFTGPSQLFETSTSGDQLMQTERTELSQLSTGVQNEGSNSTSNSSSLLADQPSSETLPFIESVASTSPWWRVVGEERWVRSTIPAMNSVGQSVAPLGRSMKQALAILMAQPATVDLTPSPTGSSGLDTSLKRPSIQSRLEQQTLFQNSSLLNELLV